MGVQHKEDSIKEHAERRQREADLLAASALAFVVLAEAGQIDSTTATEHMTLFGAWAHPVSYTLGQIRQHNGKLYKCVSAHTSQEGWAPDVAASLWAVTGDPTVEWPDWSQPLGSHDAYSKGDKVAHKSKHWVSDADGNVWEPSVYGWTEAK